MSMEKKRPWKQTARALNADELNRLRAVVKLQFVGKCKQDWKLTTDRCQFASRNAAMLEIALTCAQPMRIWRLIQYGQVMEDRGGDIRSHLQLEGKKYEINSRLRAALIEYISEQRFEFKPTDPLFFSNLSKTKHGRGSPTLRPCSARTLEELFKAFFYLSGIKKDEGALTTACFRKTAAVSLWQTTKDVKALAALLNISALSAKAYIPSENEQKDDASLQVIKSRKRKPIESASCNDDICKRNKRS